jgi:hypothetical protein
VKVGLVGVGLVEWGWWSGVGGVGVVGVGLVGLDDQEVGRVFAGSDEAVLVDLEAC